MVGTQDRRTRDGERLARNAVQIRKMTFTDLLARGRFIQSDHLHRNGIQEISHVRIVESNMAVFSEADKRDIDRALLDNLHIALRFLLRLGRIAIEVVHRVWVNTINAANRANAQLSIGPKTPEGRAKSSLNAVKNGLTGRTVLLPGDDAAAYEHHVASFFSDWKPLGEDETRLVQSLADTEWRLLRIPSLEMGIYAVGRLEFAELFADEDETMRKALIEAKIFIAYQRQLNNLSIQENRLRRQREKDAAALRDLQEKRRRAAQIATKPPQLGSNFQQTGTALEPLDFESDSIAHFSPHLRRKDAA